MSLLGVPTAVPRPSRGGSQLTRSSVQVHRVDDMRGGWVIGDFVPSALRTSAVEVACKTLAAGAQEPSHEHRIATEVTIVVAGSLRFCGRVLRAGDVLVAPPFTASGCEALEDTSLVVVKTPSVPGDKFLVPEDPRTWA